MIRSGSNRQDAKTAKLMRSTVLIPVSFFHLAILAPWRLID